MLRNKSKKTIAIVLFSILLASFIIHFLKLTSDFHRERMPWSIRTVTPENICAVSILVFPWFFLSKKELLMDYMFYVGIISGIGATVFPEIVIDMNAFVFETIRYYMHHIIIWIVPLLMVLLKVHTLDYKRIFKLPFLAFLILGVILVNEVILTSVGLLNEWHLFHNEIRNDALLFGPNTYFPFIDKLFLPLTPELFTTVPFGENAGADLYWPIIWMIIPVYIYLVVFSLLMALPFEYKNMKNDVSYLLRKVFTR